MTDWESVLNYIFENSLIPDIILAIFYLIAFWLSFSQVYLKSYRILRKNLKLKKMEIDLILCQV